MNLSMDAAIGLVGIGVFQIHDIYSQHAGSLDEMRHASPSDLSHVMKLQDADILVGAITLIVGGSLSLASGKVFPLGLAVGAYFLIAAYYHSALNTSAPIAEDISND
jgi:hypothetical protein